MNKNVWHTFESYLCMQKGLVQDNGHLLVPVLRKKWYIAEKMLVEFAEIEQKHGWHGK